MYKSSVTRIRGLALDEECPPSSEALLLLTQDGSHTVLNPALGETYHSRFGAIQESRHVFIEAGLKPIMAGRGKINILEVGFGTGLNALLTYWECLKFAVHIDYTAVEPHPLAEGLVRKLNYVKEIGAADLSGVFLEFHHSPWNFVQTIFTHFTLRKLQDKIQDAVFHTCFDVVYFDAFAPDAQPDMWSPVVFEKIFAALNSGGILVTYCAKGSVKRTLKSVGFGVETLPGPVGKREMVRAKKPQ